MSKIGIVLTESNKDLLDYLNTFQGLNATNAINKALEIAYKEHLTNVIKYKKTIENLRKGFLNIENQDTEQSTSRLVDKETKDSQTENNIDYSLLDFKNFRLATKDDINAGADIIWLSSANVRHYDKNYNLSKGIRRRNKIDYLTKKVDTLYAFIKTEQQEQQ